MAGFVISFGNMAFTILTKEIDLKSSSAKAILFSGISNIYFIIYFFS